MIKVMIVDDHSLIRTGLRLLLKGEADLSVTAEAATAEEALEKLGASPVDIMILDISMPGMGGLACITEAKRLCPQLRIIMLSMHEDENYIRQAMQAGASAYVQKSAADTDLFKAIEAVQAGELYLSQQDSKLLLHVLLSREQETVDKQAPYVLLSPREREVLRLIAHGYSLAEVAERLSLSIKTVDTYKVRLMEKLAATKKSELVSYALKYGLLSGE